MRCPKCSYISFGSANKCRNCGYDFSLSQEREPIDLPIQSGAEPIGPMGDLPLESRGAARERDLRTEADLEPVIAGQTVPARLDLPLFASEDVPLVTPPAVPRPPLSVRRAATAPARVRSRSGPGDLPLDDGHEAARQRARRAFDAVPRTEWAAEEAGPASDPCLRRVAAGAIDAALIGSLDLAVVHFTLQIVGLTFNQILLLPMVPLAAFLLLFNGGYFVLFTAAGGQTIGKMIGGVRVVVDSDAGPRRVGFGTSLKRAAGYLLSLLPAGMGWLPILTPGRRTLHDRLASTRVVRA